MNKQRCDGRENFDIREVSVKYDAFGYSNASVLFSQGRTKVLVAVTLQQGVPHFLKGQKKGWLTAEYSMLPTATHQRTQRESNQGQRNFRNIEISRLIGRCLRSVIDLSSLGERTIFVDCDVLQADGGTRVACITGASLAIQLAMKRWVAQGVIAQNLMRYPLFALSVGLVRDAICVDLSYEEDSCADADFNIVTTGMGDIVEVQGTGEKKPLSDDLFTQLKNAALQGIKSLADQIDQYKKPKLVEQNALNSTQSSASSSGKVTKGRAPFFSLSSRLK